MMNPFNQFRCIFERFENLNLAILMEDLRNHRVARDEWIQSRPDVTGKLLCPLAHGANVVVEDVVLAREDEYDLAEKQLGVCQSKLELFVRKWDCDGDRLRLLNVLKSIWAERMADAEAVQEVIGSPAPVNT